MRAYAVMIAVGLSFATEAAAEPPTAPVRKAEQVVERDKPVVIAAADEAQAQASGPKQESKLPATPVRRARVTTCRCGDQNPSD